MNAVFPLAHHDYRAWQRLVGPRLAMMRPPRLRDVIGEPDVRSAYELTALRMWLALQPRGATLRVQYRRRLLYVEK